MFTFPRSILSLLFLMLPYHFVLGALKPGAEIYNEFLEKGLIYPDENWQKYVFEVGNRLLSATANFDSAYVFVVVDQSIVNAWATPDGYIFLTRGLLAHLNSEDEMASVLGHEIGHVVGEHSKKTLSRDRLSKLMGLVGMFATGSSATSSMINTVSTAQLADYRREHELEADEYGLRFLSLAGYDPQASLESIQKVRDHDNFEKLTKNKPTVYHGILGSHPAHAKRLNELLRQSDQRQEVRLRPPERDFLSMVSGLRFGDEVSTGMIQEGKYYHGTLRLVVEFPRTWVLRATASEIIGSSSDSQNLSEIVLKRMAPSAEAATPEQYLRETLKRDDLVEGREIQVDYFPGYLAMVEASKLNYREQIAILYKDRGVYLFSGKCKSAVDLEACDKNFHTTVQSFRAMTAEDLRLINKQRIKVVVARPGDTYAKLAAFSLAGVDGEETLRVLNGHHPRGEPRAGDKIKIVE